MRSLVGVFCVAVLGCGSADFGSKSLWPAGVTRLVVSSSPGHPWCASERWSLTFDGSLEYTVNSPNGASSGCETATGSRPLNQADLTRLDAAMNALTRTPTTSCIADAGGTYAELTTATGSKLYGEGPGVCTFDKSLITVSGLQTVLDTLRNWAP
jgi:hypothetical protein